MDWGRERWIGFIKIDGPRWSALSFDARNLYPLLLRAADRCGVIELDNIDGLPSLGSLLRAPWEELEGLIAELVRRQRVLIEGNKLHILNYMDVPNLPTGGYVRLYTRDTAGSTALSWRARGLLCQILRHLDRTGRVETGKRGEAALASLLRTDPATLAPLLGELLEDGCVVATLREGVLGYDVPNFEAAQTCKRDDAARKRDERERARAERRHGWPDTPTAPRSDRSPASEPPISEVPASDEIPAISSDRPDVSAPVPLSDLSDQARPASQHQPACALEPAVEPEPDPGPPVAAPAHTPADLDLVGLAQKLAEMGNTFGAKMAGILAQGGKLTPGQRGVLRRIGDEQRAAANVVGPGSPGALFVAAEWVRIRRARRLPAGPPDPRQAAALWARAEECLAASPEVERPTPQTVVTHWITCYLAETQNRAGGIEDRGHPLFWLVRDAADKYPLPKAPRPPAPPALVDPFEDQAPETSRSPGHPPPGAPVSEERIRPAARTLAVEVQRPRGCVVPSAQETAAALARFEQAGASYAPRALEAGDPLDALRERRAAAGAKS